MRHDPEIDIFESCCSLLVGLNEEQMRT
jgi:hypothetical protein